jgi:hypothetical protein
MRATVDNQNGYWENLRFKALNDEILREFGGSWEAAPTFPADFQEDERFRRLRQRADSLVEEFEGREPWGWKDPRNSLTLPFWSALMPNLKVIVCLRNPYEVYLSLRERRYSPHPRGLDLWRVFNQSILDATTLEQRLVTHYDSHFRDTQGELRRMLDFLSMPPATGKSAHPSGAVRRRLRTHYYSESDLLALGVERRILDLYAKLCAEADYRGGAQPVGSAQRGDSRA